MHESLDHVIASAKSHIWSTQKQGCYWLYPPFLGSFYISQHYLVMCYLGRIESSKIDLEHFKNILLNTQLPDGSWKQQLEVNRVTGDLDSTVFNYWFLKASKLLSVEDDILKRARAYVREHGGLDAVSHMTKIWLCLFGQYNWDELESIPLFAFRDDYLYRFSNCRQWVAQWVKSN
jgi:squalene-hopene/tetraprenyl-beta-curcumene cyclase